MCAPDSGARAHASSALAVLGGSRRFVDTLLLLCLGGTALDPELACLAFWPNPNELHVVYGSVRVIGQLCAVCVHSCLLQQVVLPGRFRALLLTCRVAAHLHGVFVLSGIGHPRPMGAW